MLALDVVDEGVLTPNESTSLAAQLSALEQQRTFLVWSRTRDGKALSLAGRLSSVNFDGQNALITPKFKSLPGTTPDIVTTAQKEELDRKWVGYYTRFGPDAIFAEGWTQAGDWIDVRYWLDWITKAMQSEVYTLLRQHPTRVPQTAEGLASIEAAIERVCEAGRRNGGIAPGRVSEAVANNIRLATNNPAFDGFLANGVSGGNRLHSRSATDTPRRPQEPDDPGMAEGQRSRTPHNHRTGIHRVGGKTMFFSLQDVTVLLNGHTVEGEQTIKGWSGDTDALTLPDAFEFASVRRGATGDMAAFSTGDRGGPVTLKLMPNSPSVPFLMKQVTRILGDKAEVIWEGSVKHKRTGASVTLKRGVLISGPVWYTMGKGEAGNLTFNWEFEEIIPDFTTVNFADVPVLGL